MDERDVEDDASRDGTHEPVGDDGSLLTSRVGERNGKSDTDAHKVETGSGGTKGTRRATSDVIEEDVHKEKHVQSEEKSEEERNPVSLAREGHDGQARSQSETKEESVETKSRSQWMSECNRERERPHWRKVSTTTRAFMSRVLTRSMPRKTVCRLWSRRANDGSQRWLLRAKRHGPTHPTAKYRRLVAMMWAFRSPFSIWSYACEKAWSCFSSPRIDGSAPAENDDRP
jgi:hypothetical protein